MPKLRLLLIAFALVSAPLTVVAEDKITLAEVLPILAGSEMGATPIMSAPAPGTSRTVRAADIRAALRAQGKDVQGLVIPDATIIHRESRVIAHDELEQMVRPAVTSAFAPCTVNDITIPSQVIVGSGEVGVRAVGTPPSQGGRASANVVLHVGDRDTRIAVGADVVCPPPAMTPGSRVSIVVVVGNVRATAPGTALQSGRVGEEIRVTNNLSNAAIRARIVDGTTVEVRP